ncbi:curli-like amyloid fiber formation chaperone CsgH [Devosia sp. A369]
MTIPTRRSSAILLGLALATIAAGAGLANSTAAATKCGVTSTTEHGMLTLEGSILSPVAVSGDYRFAIRSSSNGGSSNISQGGHFTAAANEVTALGNVMLNAGANYDVSLEITAGGQKIMCDQDVASLT